MQRAAEPILEREGLALELDAIVSEDLRPDIGLRGPLHVWIAKLKYNLRVAGGETIGVRNPTPKDEAVVVESEIRRIYEQDFADLDWCAYEWLR
jgi:hypothetical protein